MDKPAVAFHTYLKDGLGNPMSVYRMTSERCPACSPATKEARLGVTHESNDKRHETVICLYCDFVLTRPFRDPPGRKMNAGRSDGGLGEA